MTGPIDNQERLKRALTALREMQGQLDALQKSRHEPIAVIGIGCRFPGGVDSPASFWSLLRDGVDAIREVPPDRWNWRDYYSEHSTQPEKNVTRFGGFLDHADCFDGDFFGISPREASSLDPQQRLLLEVAWEALENAGIAPRSRKNTATGVYVGISSGDYAQQLIERDPADYDLYMGSGNAHSVAAGRLSYFLGLQGPCVALDTACSSSLTAVHLACQSLHLQECTMALAAGVNLLLSPVISINHTKSKMLAPDGRCKTFDAAADGFIRSDGCGVVLLKRLSDAQKDGDSIFAIIRGSAVNQDGHTSGLTVPNGLAQQAVIRRALTDAGVQPAQVHYVEAHGTGTSLGDPIEVEALAAVYGKGRALDDPLLIGSVKTNFGHAEAAAGVAGLIKAILCLNHEVIPPHLHFKNPNPHIDWPHLPIKVSAQGDAWPKSNQSRIAGVSSFGFGGSNAHVIVEESPADVSFSNERERPLHLLILSAKNEEALRESTYRHEKFLSENPHFDFADICHTASTGRSHFSHRLALPASSAADAVRLLRECSSGVEHPERIHGNTGEAQTGRVVFLFTGQGSQYPGMGRELYETHPGFRQTLQECDEILRGQLEVPLLEILYPREENDPRLHQTAYTQPALFALEYALAKLWMSWGIQPAAVMGHSVGEYTAACVAGVISQEDGLRLIAQRGRLMQSLPQNGAMAAVLTDERTVRDAIHEEANSVSIAAFNGPHHIVISGPIDAVNRILLRMKSKNIEVRPLQVSHAFHSFLMEPILNVFEDAAASVRFSLPKIELISNRTGQPAGEEITRPAYWRHHVREAVCFEGSLQTLYANGHRIFLEIGPKPVLLGMARACVPSNECQWLESIRPGQANWSSLLASLGWLYAHGAQVDWAGFDQGYRRRRVQLPTYPFQRKRHWISATSPKNDNFCGGQKSLRPLVDQQVHSAIHPEEILFQSSIGLHSPEFLNDHRVFGSPVVPSSVFVEMVLQAAFVHWKKSLLELLNFTVHQPLVLSEEGIEKTLQLVLTLQSENEASFQIFARNAPDEQRSSDWARYASGTIRVPSKIEKSECVDIAVLQNTIMNPVDIHHFYHSYRERGVEFGPSFQAVQQVWRSQNEALGVVCLPECAASNSPNYFLHPVLFDACAQVLGALFLEEPSNEIYLQTHIERYMFHPSAPREAWVLARLQNAPDRTTDCHRADLLLLDSTGNKIAEISGMTIRRAHPASLHPVSIPRNQLVTLEWRPCPREDHQPLISNIPAFLDFLQHRMNGLANQQELQEYGVFLKELDKLSVGYFLCALRKIGWRPVPGDRFFMLEILDRLRIAKPHRRLMHRLFSMLESRGFLRTWGEEWEILRSLDAPDVQAQWTKLNQKYPFGEAELILLQRCGMQLAEILRGHCDALELLFPKDDSTTLNKLYQESPGAQFMNGMLCEAIERIIAFCPPERRFRILEIGAGTGGATTYLLPRLSPERTEYVFTDISPVFLANAKTKFAQYPLIRYQVLDIEKSPAAQGFTDGSFDCVIAFNVLHATRDLHITLRHTHEMLRPGGVLLLLENTVAMDWVELVWGLTEGWWRFEDSALRSSHPLLNADQWKRVLTETGFTPMEALTPDPVQHADLSKQSLLIAHAANNVNLREHWLIFTGKNGWKEKWRKATSAGNHSCTLIQAGSAYQKISSSDFQIDPLCPEHYHRLFVEIETKQPTQILYSWGLGEPVAEEMNSADILFRSRENFLGLLYLVQALQKAKDITSSTLWILTRNAQSIDANSMLEGLMQTPLWGLAKNIALESPEIWGGALDIDTGETMDAAEILDEIRFSNHEDHIARRGAERYVARIVPWYGEPSRTISIHDNASYLITGGCGALGLRTACWLADRGARHLILLGRNGAVSKEAQKTMDRLQERGVQIAVHCTDVSNEIAMSVVFDSIKTNRPPLRGVIHSAGLPGSCPLDRLDAPAVDALFAAKVAGAWNLHRQTQGMKLDFFVCYSSMVSLWGAKGQSHYVAANHFLDLFAAYRRRMGLPCQTLNWGPLTGGGMLPEEARPELQRMGVRTMDMEHAVQSLDVLLSMDRAQVAWVDIDWRQFKSVYEARGSRSLFEEIISESNSMHRGGNVPTNNVLDKLSSSPVHRQREILSGYIKEELMSVLGLESIQTVSDKKGFFDMGMDSLTAIELKNRLENGIKQTLPSTLAFDYATVQTLTEFLLLQISEMGSLPVSLSTQEPSKPISQEEVKNLSEEEAEALLLKKLELL